ncbi:cob(I)yrinic acid a c-diamide adenosyltransferase [bacterium D16-54]|nr:cob(I)yrinic acid a c-diamide adenosyltransferase [bacterium D16-54]RKJ16946.1 cob(I)yrinic acid a c-diamide adenosyltransferase [bacterium D16-56]
MNTGKIEIIYGEGSGRTAMALGKGLEALSRHKKVIVIQFLKGNQKEESLKVMRRLEPDMNLFCFEKACCKFDELSEQEKQEECINIRNGVNYARKVLATGECDLLILDEVLGLLEQEILLEQELLQILESRDSADVILTGRILQDGLAAAADQVERITRIGCGREAENGYGSGSNL